MSGGSGSEWLFGTGHPHGDTKCEDWRSRDRMWDQTRWALEFFGAYVPVREAEPARALVAPATAFCLAKPGSVYAIYLPEGGPASLRLDAGRYRVDWYNPRAGCTCSATAINGGGTTWSFTRPSNAVDWALIVRNSTNIPTLGVNACTAPADCP